MKELLDSILNNNKRSSLILVNILPFLLNLLLFFTGCMDDLILFLPVFVGLTVLNLKNCDRVLPFLLLQALILVCTVVSGYLSSFLYYHLISDDYLTPVIGELFVLLEVAVNVIVTPIAAIFKAVVKKIQPSK